MTTSGRGGAWIVLIALVMALLGTEVRAEATVSGTPTPAGCDRGAGAGTPVVSPDAREGTPVTGTPQALSEVEGLRAAFAAQGMQIVTEEALVQEFFTAEQVARVVLTGGPLGEPAELQIYEYVNAGALAVDAAQITPDGNLTTVMIMWVATPHFFCGERMIVLYLGNDPAMIAVLTELLGPQLAGR